MEDITWAEVVCNLQGEIKKNHRIHKREEQGFSQEDKGPGGRKDRDEVFERDTRRFHIVGYRIDLDRGNVHVNGEV